MRKPKLFVKGTNLQIIQRPGHVKVDMHGRGGWTSIWGTDTDELLRRIKIAPSLFGRL